MTAWNALINEVEFTDAQQLVCMAQVASSLPAPHLGQNEQST